MQVKLSDHAEQLVQQLLSSGDYTSATEVIEAGISVLDLKSKIQEGLDDAEAGRIAPLDIENIKRRGRERLVGKQSQE